MADLHTLDGFDFNGDKGDNRVGMFGFNTRGKWKLGCRYYSEDKWSRNGLEWSCSIQMFQEGQIQVCVELPRNDNPLLRFCVLDFTITLINSNPNKNIPLLFQSHKKLRIGGKYFAETIVNWMTVGDTNQGFLDDNDKFWIRLEIRKIREIKSDMVVIFIILIMMIFMLIVITLMYSLNDI